MKIALSVGVAIMLICQIGRSVAYAYDLREGISLVLLGSLFPFQEFQVIGNLLKVYICGRFAQLPLSRKHLNRLHTHTKDDYEAEDQDCRAESS